MRKRVNEARLREVQAHRARCFELVQANERALDLLNARYRRPKGERAPGIKSAAQRIAEIDQEVEYMMHHYVYESEPPNPSWFMRLFHWLFGT
jgi:hypothetical protein